MKRLLPVIALNLLVPGTGLILLGRPWLGLALAIWFGLGAEIAACGLLIAPASLPLMMTGAAGILAAAAWLLAQRLMAMRIGEVLRPTAAAPDGVE